MAYEELKARQSVAWGNGPYQRITETIADLQQHVTDRLQPEAGVEWLDLACGTGAVAELAAARGASVTGLDLAPARLEILQTTMMPAVITRSTQRLTLRVYVRACDGQGVRGALVLATPTPFAQFSGPERARRGWNRRLGPARTIRGRNFVSLT